MIWLKLSNPNYGRKEPKKVVRYLMLDEIVCLSEHILDDRNINESTFRSPRPIFSKSFFKRSKGHLRWPKNLLVCSLNDTCRGLSLRHAGFNPNDLVRPQNTTEQSSTTEMSPHRKITKSFLDTITVNFQAVPLIDSHMSVALNVSPFYHHTV